MHKETTNNATQQETQNSKETINHIITQSMRKSNDLSYALFTASVELSKKLNITEIKAKSQIMDYFIHSPLLTH